MLRHPIRFYDGSFEDWSRQPAATFPVEASAPARAPASKLDRVPRTLVIPALLQTTQTTAIAEYLRVFNSGDATRMGAFIEQSMLPNAARSMEARIKSYTNLHDELGALSIDSVNRGAQPNSDRGQNARQWRQAGRVDPCLGRECAVPHHDDRLQGGGPD